MNKIQDYYNDTHRDIDYTPFSFDYYRNKHYPKLFPIKTVPTKVLDIGCESGNLCEWLSKRGYQPIGIDISSIAYEMAKKRGITTICLNIDEEPLPFENDSFNEIFMGDILEHIFNVETVIKEVHRILKPNGLIKFTVPNMAFLPLRLRYLITGQIPTTNPVRGSYRHDLPWKWEHIRFYNLKSIHQLMIMNNFNKVLLQGIAGNSFSVLSKIQPMLFSHSIIGVYKK